MSHEIDPRDVLETSQPADAAADGRREWVTPSIAELPIAASQGPVNTHAAVDTPFIYS